MYNIDILTGNSKCYSVLSCSQKWLSFGATIRGEYGIIELFLFQQHNKYNISNLIGLVMQS